MTPTLDWKKHLSEVTRRVYSILHILRFYRRFLSRSLRLWKAWSSSALIIKAYVRFVIGHLPFLTHVTVSLKIRKTENSYGWKGVDPRALHAFKLYLFETLFARDMTDWAVLVRDERFPRLLLNPLRAKMA